MSMPDSYPGSSIRASCRNAVVWSLIFAVVAAGRAAAPGSTSSRSISRRRTEEAAQAEIAAGSRAGRGARLPARHKPGSAQDRARRSRSARWLPDPWERGKCTPLVGKLSRGAAPDTGIAAIETAWNDLDKAAQKAARRVRRRTSGGRRARQGSAAGSTRRARCRAREAPRRPPSSPRPARRQVAPRPPQTVPLRDGKDPVTSLEIDRRFRRRTAWSAVRQDREADVQVAAGRRRHAACRARRAGRAAGRSPMRRGARPPSPVRSRSARSTAAAGCRHRRSCRCPTRRT